MAPVHADEMDGAVAGHACSSPQRLLEENPDCLRRHLAGGHGKLPVPSWRVGMSADADVVGRIEEGGIDRRIADHFLQKGGVATVAAADAVVADDPDVAELAMRLPR
ncbi:MAG TPA: hypothetical protein VHG52_07565, partial [Thermomicrobiales bacterium]|nr:hypothetical protein [Thermomicrobiales bacterium]